MLGGPPIRIPEGLTPQQLAPYRDLVQRAMDELQSRADRLARGEDVDLSPPLMESLVGEMSVTGEHTDDLRPAQAA